MQQHSGNRILSNIFHDFKFNNCDFELLLGFNNRYSLLFILCPYDYMQVLHLLLSLLNFVGQHLITAVVAEELGYATSSWWLGDEMSYLELGKFYNLRKIVIKLWWTTQVKWLFLYSFPQRFTIFCFSDTPSMSSDQVVCIETLVNQYIRESRPVTVKVFETSDPELKKVSHNVLFT